MTIQPVVLIPDHNDQAKARLTQEYKNKSNFNSLIDIRVNQIQDLENALFTFLEGRQLDFAVGVQLDLIGGLLGQARPFGMSDDIYRGLLFAQIAINTSEGTKENVINLLNLLGAEGLRVFETYPAGIDIQVIRDTIIIDEALTKNAIIKATAPIEINLRAYNAITPFGFIGNPLAFGFGAGQF